MQLLTLTLADPIPIHSRSVDNLGGGKDHPHIDVSNVVLCFCTERWFTSRACVREAIRAVLRKRPLIALLQPDTTDQHGGLTEADCRAVLRGKKVLNGPKGRLTYADRLKEHMEEVAQWSETWMEPVALPTAKDIEDALFASAPIVWSPLADLQDVTLRLIAERLLPGFTHAYGTPYKQVVFKQGEIELQLRRFRLQPKGSDPSAADRRSSVGSSSIDADAPRCRFHLFVGVHNPLARGVALEMASLLKEERLPPLLWTEDIADLEHCEHMLIHLAGDTWTRGPESDLLAHEVCAAMRAGVHRLLAHEVPGARLDDVGRGCCSFDELIQATPEHLIDAGIYNEIAMNLAGGEWRNAGLIGLIREIFKGGGTREQWRVEPNEPPIVAQAIDTPSSVHGEGHSQQPPTNAEYAVRLPRRSTRRLSRLTHDSSEAESIVSDESMTPCGSAHSNLRVRATATVSYLCVDDGRRDDRGPRLSRCSTRSSRDEAIESSVGDSTARDAPPRRRESLTTPLPAVARKQLPSVILPITAIVRLRAGAVAAHHCSGFRSRTEFEAPDGRLPLPSQLPGATELVEGALTPHPRRGIVREHTDSTIVRC